MFSEKDHLWMSRALKLARLAEKWGEVPIGAILVKDQKLIAAGFNRPISQNDPTAHAEIVCLRRAARKLKNYRLINTTLYVTLEPCLMCSGALSHARVERVVYAAPDSGKYNRGVCCEGGLMVEESVELLQGFFRERR